MSAKCVLLRPHRSGSRISRNPIHPVSASDERATPAFVSNLLAYSLLIAALQIAVVWALSR